MAYAFFTESKMIVNQPVSAGIIIKYCKTVKLICRNGSGVQWVTYLGKQWNSRGSGGPPPEIFL